MNRLLRSAAVEALFALSACGGPSSPGAALSPGSALTSGAGSSADFTARLPQNSLGGIPSFSLSISLFDAPLTFGEDDKINLAVLGVNLVDAGGVSHPMHAFKKPVIIDLLTLKKNAREFKTVATAGDYSAVEFIVVPALSSVVVSDTTYPVRFGNGEVASSTPIALDSPVAIVGADKAKVDVSIDFNALESVSLSGGVARINPRLVASTDDAEVHGKVRAADGDPVVGATVLVKDTSGAVANSSVTDKDGSFVVHALSAGKYTVVVQNTYTSASGVTVTATGASSANPRPVVVQLAAGVDLDLGELAD
jgi:hypothetical protein